MLIGEFWIWHFRRRACPCDDEKFFGSMVDWVFLIGASKSAKEFFPLLEKKLFGFVFFDECDLLHPNFVMKRGPPPPGKVEGGKKIRRL